MSYLSLLIAWFLMRDSEFVGNVWWDAYLDKLVEVETWFYHASWWVLLAFAVMAVVMFAMGFLRRRRGCGFLSGGFCFGYGVIFLSLWPLWEFITKSLASSMASAFGPEGIINQGKFIVSLVLYLLLGVG